MLYVWCYDLYHCRKKFLVQQPVYTHKRSLKHLCSIRAWVPVSFFLSFFFSLSLSIPPALFHFLIVNSRPPCPGPLKDPNSYLFILLVISFTVQKILSLMESQVFIFYFVPFPFGIRYKKLSPRSTLGANHLWFLLGILWFQVLHSSL